MLIKLNETYSIDIDSIGNHTLIKKQVIKEGKQAGETRDVIIGYYSSVPSALHKLINLQASDLPDMESLQHFYEAFTKLIDKALLDFKKASKVK